MGNRVGIAGKSNGNRQGIERELEEIGGVIERESRRNQEGIERESSGTRRGIEGESKGEAKGNRAGVGGDQRRNRGGTEGESRGGFLAFTISTLYKVLTNHMLELMMRVLAIIIVCVGLQFLVAREKQFKARCEWGRGGEGGGDGVA